MGQSESTLFQCQDCVNVQSELRSPTTNTKGDLSKVIYVTMSNDTYDDSRRDTHSMASDFFESDEREASDQVTTERNVGETRDGTSDKEEQLVENFNSTMILNSRSHNLIVDPIPSLVYSSDSDPIKSLLDDVVLEENMDNAMFHMVETSTPKRVAKDHDDILDDEGISADVDSDSILSLDSPNGPDLFSDATASYLEKKADEQMNNDTIPEGNDDDADAENGDNEPDVEERESLEYLNEAEYHQSDKDSRVFDSLCLNENEFVEENYNEVENHKGDKESVSLIENEADHYDMTHNHVQVNCDDDSGAEDVSEPILEEKASVSVINDNAGAVDVNDPIVEDNEDEADHYKTTHESVLEECDDDFEDQIDPIFKDTVTVKMSDETECDEGNNEGEAFELVCLNEDEAVQDDAIEDEEAILIDIVIETNYDDTEPNCEDDAGVDDELIFKDTPTLNVCLIEDATIPHDTDNESNLVAVENENENDSSSKDDENKPNLGNAICKDTEVTASDSFEEIFCSPVPLSSPKNLNASPSIKAAEMKKSSRVAPLSPSKVSSPTRNSSDSLSLSSSINSLSTASSHPSRWNGRTSVVCMQAYEPNLFSYMKECSRCYSLASENDQKAFRTKGSVMTIPSTKGGCASTCPYVNCKSEPEGVRLCRQCFSSLHNNPQVEKRKLNKAVDVPIPTTPRKSASPAKCSESIKPQVVVCSEKFQPNIFQCNEGCERCVSLLSNSEKAKYEKNGNSLLVTMTSGGCHESCQFFQGIPGKRGLRLCMRCFQTLHKPLTDNLKKKDEGICDRSRANAIERKPSPMRSDSRGRSASRGR